jgi:hypothetical protein
MQKVSRYIYLFAAWLFVIGVSVQVFLAGMVVVATRMGWNAHVELGHFLAGPLVFMLVSMYLGRLPGKQKWLTWLLFAVYFLQADVLIFLRVSAPALSALHPVLALVDFALGLSLARQAVKRTRPSTQAAGALTPAVEMGSTLE